MEKIKKFITLDRAIILLLFIIVVFIFFSGNNKIDYHKFEFKKLQTKYDSLYKANDSLNFKNIEYFVKIDSLEKEVKKTNDIIIIKNKEIDRLNNEKRKKIYIVNNLDANSVAVGITEYLDKK